MLNTKIENISHLTQDEVSCVKCAVYTEFKTLDDAQAELRSWFPEWFVYRGGNHVALHRSKSDEARIAIIS